MPNGGGVRVTWRSDIIKVTDGMQARCADLRPPLRRIGAFMLRSTDQNFVAQGRKGGRRNVWPKLSKATIARRKPGQTVGGIVAILQASGRLRSRSISSAVGRQHVAHGSNLPYARDHQQDGNFRGSILKQGVERIPQHRRKRSRVKAHTRTIRGRRQRVAAHTRAATTVRAHRKPFRFRLKARPYLLYHARDGKRAADQLMAHCIGRRAA